MTDEELAEKYAKGNMHYEIAKRENGADYAKEVSSVTISQAFLAGLEYKNKENAELKEKISILLSCTNCPENKGGWICAKEYENKCLTQKIEFIKELEEEKCELLGIIQGKDKVIQELEKERDKYRNMVFDQREHLTKAKEIIKDYMTIAKGAHTTLCGVPEENRTINVLQLNEEAEEFLNSEVVKK